MAVINFQVGPAFRGWQERLHVSSHMHVSQFLTTMTQRAISKTPLPVELLNCIFCDLSQRDLYSLLFVNRVFYAVAALFLYHTIALRPKPRPWCSVRPHPNPDRLVEPAASQISCLQVLCKVDHLARLVRTIDVDWRSYDFVTANLLRLLNRTLRRLNCVTSSTILLRQRTFRHTADLSWIYDGCQFSLAQFVTNEDVGAPLCRFLEAQPCITHLQVLESNSSFNLDASALPLLSHLAVVFFHPSHLAELIQGRPL
jgi:hypothetical protein